MIVTIITLWSFIFSILGNDLVWAVAKRETVPPASGIDLAPRPDQISQGEFNPETFTLPEYLGTIKDRYNAGASSPLVFHIRDAHCNYSAQHAIANLLRYLNISYQVKLVNLEGGEGAYDFSVFSALDDKRARRSVSDYLLKEGELSGAEFFAINNPGLVDLWGIEDTGLYLKNLKVYRNYVRHKKDVDEQIESLQHMLDALAYKVYSPELRELRRKRMEFKAATIELKDYMVYLLRRADKIGVKVTDVTNLAILKKTLSLQEGIDFKKSNKERDLLVSRLQKKLSKRELKALLTKLVELKLGQIEKLRFFNYLFAKADEVKADRNDLVNLKLYIGYLSLYASLDREKVFDELELLEERLQEALYTNDTQRSLARLCKNFSLIKSILTIDVTRKQYEYYIAHKDEIELNRFAAFIRKEAPRYGFDFAHRKEFLQLNTRLKEIEQFYTLGIKRDGAFIKNIKRKMQREKAQRAVVITGGFHAKNLTDLLKKRGVSYVSIMPKYGLSREASPYFKLLAGKTSEIFKYILSATSTIAIYSYFSEKSKEVYRTIDKIPEELLQQILTDSIKVIYGFLKGEKEVSVGDYQFVLLNPDDARGRTDIIEIEGAKINGCQIYAIKRGAARPTAVVGVPQAPSAAPVPIARASTGGEREKIIAKNRKRQQLSPGNEVGRTIQDFIYGLNGKLQAALLDAYPASGYPNCGLASTIAEHVIKDNFEDYDKYIKSIEQWDGEFKYRRADEISHAWLVITDINNKKYYVSFTDGQFVDPPKGIKKPAMNPTVHLNGEHIWWQWGSAEYTHWYYDVARNDYVVFLELGDSDSVEELERILEEEAGMHVVGASKLEEEKSQIFYEEAVIIAKHFPGFPIPEKPEPKEVFTKVTSNSITFHKESAEEDSGWPNKLQNYISDTTGKEVAAKIIARVASKTVTEALEEATEVTIEWGSMQNKEGKPESCTLDIYCNTTFNGKTKGIIKGRLDVLRNQPGKIADFSENAEDQRTTIHIEITAAGRASTNGGKSYGQGAGLRSSTSGRGSVSLPRVGTADVPLEYIEGIPFGVNFDRIAGFNKPLMQSILKNRAFINGSIVQLYPEMAEQEIKSVIPNPLRSQGGNELFQLLFVFKNEETRSILLMASPTLPKGADTGNRKAAFEALENKYKEIEKQDRDHKVTHRFGVGSEFSYKTDLSEHLSVTNRFLAFSLEFHEGNPLNVVTRTLEDLVGIPGLSRVSLQSFEKEVLKEKLDNLVDFKILTENRRNKILDARKKGDTDKLLVYEKRLRERIFELDRLAVRAQIRFQQVTGYIQLDARRNNIIFRMNEDGKAVVRLIDYDDMKKSGSLMEMIESFNIFSSTTATEMRKDGRSLVFIDRSVRPWAWTYLEDKSDFFETIMEYYGKDKALGEFLRGVRELEAAGRQDSPIYKYIVDFLDKKNRYLDRHQTATKAAGLSAADGPSKIEFVEDMAREIFVKAGLPETERDRYLKVIRGVAERNAGLPVPDLKEQVIDLVRSQVRVYKVTVGSRPPSADRASTRGVEAAAVEPSVVGRILPTDKLGQEDFLQLPSVRPEIRSTKDILDRLVLLRSAFAGPSEMLQNDINARSQELVNLLTHRRLLIFRDTDVIIRALSALEALFKSQREIPQSVIEDASKILVSLLTHQDLRVTRSAEHALRALVTSEREIPGKVIKGRSEELAKLLAYGNAEGKIGASSILEALFTSEREIPQGVIKDASVKLVELLAHRYYEVGKDASDALKALLASGREIPQDTLIACSKKLGTLLTRRNFFISRNLVSPLTRRRLFTSSDDDAKRYALSVLKALFTSGREIPQEVINNTSARLVKLASNRGSMLRKSALSVLGSLVAKNRAYPKEVKEAIKRHDIGLASIQLYNGGVAKDPTPILSMLDTDTLSVERLRFPTKQTSDSAVFTEVLTLSGLQEKAKEIDSAMGVGELEFQKAMGRSLVYRHTESGNLIVIKILKKSEEKDQGILQYEADMFDVAKEYELEPDAPIPLRMGLGKEVGFRLDSSVITPEIRGALDECIDNAKGAYEIDPDYRAFAFMVKRKEVKDAEVEDKELERRKQYGYTNYIKDNETRIGFETAAKTSARKLGNMARKGFIHTALVDIFHNLSGEERRYIWFVSLLEGFGNRGAGRLTAWRKAVAFANVGINGEIRDWADVKHIDDILKEEGSKKRATDYLVGQFGDKAINFYMMGALGEYTLAIILMYGDWLISKGEMPEWGNEDDIAEMGKFIEELYFETIAGYLDEDIEQVRREYEGLGDFDQIARQMAFFMTGREEVENGKRFRETYVEYLNEGRKFPQEIFGEGVLELGDLAPETYDNIIGHKGGEEEPEDIRNEPALGPFNGPLPIQAIVTNNILVLGFAVNQSIAKQHQTGPSFAAERLVPAGTPRTSYNSRASTRGVEAAAVAQSARRKSSSGEASQFTRGKAPSEAALAGLPLDQLAIAGEPYIVTDAGLAEALIQSTESLPVKAMTLNTRGTFSDVYYFRDRPDFVFKRIKPGRAKGLYRMEAKEMDKVVKARQQKGPVELVDMQVTGTKKIQLIKAPGLAATRYVYNGKPFDAGGEIIIVQEMLVPTEGKGALRLRRGQGRNRFRHQTAEKEERLKRDLAGQNIVFDAGPGNLGYQSTIEELKKDFESQGITADADLRPDNFGRRGNEVVLFDFGGTRVSSSPDERASTSGVVLDEGIKEDEYIGSSSPFPNKSVGIEAEQRQDAEKLRQYRKNTAMRFVWTTAAFMSMVILGMPALLDIIAGSKSGYSAASLAITTVILTGLIFSSATNLFKTLVPPQKIFRDNVVNDRSKKEPVVRYVIEAVDPVTRRDWMRHVFMLALGGFSTMSLFWTGILREFAATMDLRMDIIKSLEEIYGGNFIDRVRFVSRRRMEQIAMDHGAGAAANHISGFAQKGGPLYVAVQGLTGKEWDELFSGPGSARAWRDWFSGRVEKTFHEFMEDAKHPVIRKRALVSMLQTAYHEAYHGRLQPIRKDADLSKGDWSITGSVIFSETFGSEYLETAGWIVHARTSAERQQHFEILPPEIRTSFALMDMIRADLQSLKVYRNTSVIWEETGANILETMSVGATEAFDNMTHAQRVHRTREILAGRGRKAFRDEITAAFVYSLRPDQFERLKAYYEDLLNVPLITPRCVAEKNAQVQLGIPVAAAGFPAAFYAVPGAPARVSTLESTGGQKTTIPVFKDIKLLKNNTDFTWKIEDSKTGKTWYMKLDVPMDELIGYHLADLAQANVPPWGYTPFVDLVKGITVPAILTNEWDRAVADVKDPVRAIVLFRRDINSLEEEELVHKDSSGLEESLLFLRFAGVSDYDYESREIGTDDDKLLRYVFFDLPSVANEDMADHIHYEDFIAGIIGGRIKLDAQRLSRAVEYIKTIDLEKFRSEVLVPEIGEEQARTITDELQKRQKVIGRMFIRDMRRSIKPTLSFYEVSPVKIKTGSLNPESTISRLLEEENFADIVWNGILSATIGTERVPLLHELLEMNEREIRQWALENHPHLREILIEIQETIQRTFDLFETTFRPRVDAIKGARLTASEGRGRLLQRKLNDQIRNLKNLDISKSVIYKEIDRATSQILPEDIPRTSTSGQQDERTSEKKAAEQIVAEVPTGQPAPREARTVAETGILRRGLSRLQEFLTPILTPLIFMIVIFLSARSIDVSQETRSTLPSRPQQGQKVKLPTAEFDMPEFISPSEVEDARLQGKDVKMLKIEVEPLRTIRSKHILWDSSFFGEGNNFFDKGIKWTIAKNKKAEGKSPTDIYIDFFGGDILRIGHGGKLYYQRKSQNEKGWMEISIDDLEQFLELQRSKINLARRAMAPSIKVIDATPIIGPMKTWWGEFKTQRDLKNTEQRYEEAQIRFDHFEAGRSKGYTDFLNNPLILLVIVSALSIVFAFIFVYKVFRLSISRDLPNEVTPAAEPPDAKPPSAREVTPGGNNNGQGVSKYGGQRESTGGLNDRIIQSEFFDPSGEKWLAARNFNVRVVPQNTGRGTKKFRQYWDLVETIRMFAQRRGFHITDTVIGELADNASKKNGSIGWKVERNAQGQPHTLIIATRSYDPGFKKGIVKSIGPGVTTDEQSGKVAGLWMVFNFVVSMGRGELTIEAEDGDKGRRRVVIRKRPEGSHDPTAQYKTVQEKKGTLIQIALDLPKEATRASTAGEIGFDEEFETIFDMRLNEKGKVISSFIEKERKIVRQERVKGRISLSIDLDDTIIDRAGNARPGMIGLLTLLRDKYNVRLVLWTNANRPAVQKAINQNPALSELFDYDPTGRKNRVITRERFRNLPDEFQAAVDKGLLSEREAAFHQRFVLDLKGKQFGKGKNPALFGYAAHIDDAGLAQLWGGLLTDSYDDINELLNPERFNLPPITLSNDERTALEEERERLKAQVIMIDKFDSDLLATLNGMPTLDEKAEKAIGQILPKLNTALGTAITIGDVAEKEKEVLTRLGYRARRETTAGIHSRERIRSELEAHNWYYQTLGKTEKKEVTSRLDRFAAPELIDILEKNIDGEIKAVYLMGSSIWGPRVISGVKNYQFKDLDTVVVVKGLKTDKSVITVRKGLTRLGIQKIDARIIREEALQAETLPVNIRHVAVSAWGSGVLVYGSNYFTRPPPEDELIDKIAGNLLPSLLSEISIYKKNRKKRSNALKKIKGKRKGEQRREIEAQFERTERLSQLRAIKRLTEILLVIGMINRLYRPDNAIPGELVTEDIDRISGAWLINQLLGARGAREELFTMLPTGQLTIFADIIRADLLAAEERKSTPEAKKTGVQGDSTHGGQRKSTSGLATAAARLPASIREAETALSSTDIERLEMMPEIKALLETLQKTKKPEEAAWIREVVRDAARIHKPAQEVLAETRSPEDKRYIFIPLSLSPLDTIISRSKYQGAWRYLRERIDNEYNLSDVSVIFYETLEDLEGKITAAMKRGNTFSYIDAEEAASDQAAYNGILKHDITTVREQAATGGSYINLNGHVALAIGVLDLINNDRDGEYALRVMDLINAMMKEGEALSAANPEDLIEMIKKNKVVIMLPALHKLDIEENVKTRLLMDRALLESL